MMTNLRRAHFILPVLLSAAILLQCKKEENAASVPSGAQERASTPQVAKQPALSESAPKLGFAAKLPVTTEFYLGTTGLKGHLAALKKSAFWKDAEALFNDKLPAPSAGDKSFDSMQKLWGDDFFIAGGAGFSESALAWRELSRLSTEMNFRSLMAGTSGAPAGAKKAAPLKMLDDLLKDPETLRRAEALFSKLEAPPLMIGIKVDKPEEMLKQLITDAMLKDATKMGTLSDFTTPEGYAFKVIEFDGHKLIADNDRMDFVTNMPSDTAPEIRKLADKLLTHLQSKKISFAYGAAGDHLILACGKNLDHLKFVPSARQSLLTKPEMALLAPYTGKNLLGLVYAAPGVVSAMSNDQPIVPMVRGVVSAMKDSDMFRETAHKLIGQVDELAALEVKAHTKECSTLVAVAWWDKGLHAEMFGGAKPRFYRSGTPLQFASLLDKPGVLFGMAFNRDKDYEKDSRAWMEKLTSMIYTAAQELVQAGVAGKDGGQQLAVFEKNVRPTFEKIYQADKELAEKALGGQSAYIIDMNGKLPPMPGLPPDSKGTRIPRLYSVSEVTDRAQITKNWAAMSEAIAASTSGKDAKGNPTGFPMPEPISSEKNGVTTYFYALPFFSGDVLPCASINDKLLILSSSKEGAEAMAGDIAKAVPGTVDGCVWKLDVGLLSEAMKTSTALRGGAEAAGGAEIKESTKWLKPFHILQGHTFEENGRLRGSISWEISDVLKFD